MSEPTQAQIDAITRLLIDASEPKRLRSEMEYDGINGTPPAELIPLHYRNDFIRIRGRLLDARGYTHDALMVWLDRYRDHFLLDTEMDDGFPVVREYPNGDPIDRYCFMDEIGLLAWLRWCVKDIDEETAKEQLDAGLPDSEQKQKDGRNKGLSEIKKNQDKMRSIESWCIQYADKKRRNRNREYSARELAKMMHDKAKIELEAKCQLADVEVPAKGTIAKWLSKDSKE